MATTITLTLPDQLYEQAKRFAYQQPQEPNVLLVDEIAKTIYAKSASEMEPNSILSYEPDAAVERERQAYIALHPSLKKKYLEKHVAIYEGQLIDYDDDFSALYARIDSKYPELFVWLDTVAEEAIETIILRSPVSLEN